MTESVVRQKHPLDIAPDWTDQTFSRRARDCAMFLNLLGALDEEASITVLNEIERWENEKEKTENG